MTSGENHNDINSAGIVIALIGFLYLHLPAAFIILWCCMGWIFTYRFPPDFFDIKCESSKHHKIISWCSRQIFNHRGCIHHYKTWVFVFGLVYAGVCYAEQVFRDVPVTESAALFNLWVFGGLQAQCSHIFVDRNLPY